MFKPLHFFVNLALMELGFIFLDLFLAAIGSVLITQWLLLILFWSHLSLLQGLGRR